MFLYPATAASSAYILVRFSFFTFSIDCLIRTKSLWREYFANIIEILNFSTVILSMRQIDRIMTGHYTEGGFFGTSVLVGPTEGSKFQERTCLSKNTSAEGICKPTLMNRTNANGDFVVVCTFPLYNRSTVFSAAAE